MKILRFTIVLAALGILPAQTQPGCSGCAATAPAKTQAEELAAMPTGPIENLMPLGVLVALGCEKCAEGAVQRALQLGSTPAEVDRALRTLETMKTMECFQRQFGPDAASRVDKPLAAARRALQQAAK